MTLKAEHIVIAIMLLIILYLQQCRIPHWRDRDVMELRDTIYRDTGRVVIDSVPYPAYVTLPGTTDTLIDTFRIPVATDTAAILADYYRARNYINSYDTNDVSVTLTEVVAANRIQSRRLTIKNNRATQVIQPDNRRGRILLGGFVGGKPFEAGLSGAWQTKQYNIYQYHYDIINRGHRITLLWPISLKK